MRWLALLVLTGFLAACAVTELDTYTDPNFRPSDPYRSIIVFGDLMRLGERQVAEQRLVEVLERAGSSAHVGMEYFPPTREINAEQFAQAIRATGADAILFIVAGDKDTTESYVPPTYQGYGYVSGNQVYTTTYPIGGYSQSRPHAYYTASLMDAATGEIMWQADGSSRGNAYAGFDDLTRSAAEEVARRLVSEGLVASTAEGRAAVLREGMGVPSGGDIGGFND